MGDKDKKYVHMLNSTLCATGRAICCLLETYQEADGVRVPDVLVPFMGGMTFLPFVRESRDIKSGVKTSVTQDKPLPKFAAPVAAAYPNTSAADAPMTETSPVLSAEGELLKKSIEDCGAAIKEKKAAKAGKDEIKALVDQLIALKMNFTEVTGLVFEGDNSGKKESKKVPAASTVVCLPPAIAIEPPASVAASIPRRTRISLPIPTSVWKQEFVDLARLEEQLKIHSYVTGAQPSIEDLRVVSALALGETDLQKMLMYCASAPVTDRPQIARWLRSIASFSVDDMSTWR